jgi:hypothetical protein
LGTSKTPRPGMPAELQGLLERFCQLGRLLPPLDSLREDPRDDDPAVVAEAKVVLAEMARVKQQIDAFLRMGKA